MFVCAQETQKKSQVQRDLYPYFALNTLQLLSNQQNDVNIEQY